MLLWTSQIPRLALYFFLLAFTIIAQLKNPNFINSGFLIPMYGFLFLAFSISLIFHYVTQEKRELNSWALKLLLPIDALFITLILYNTGFQVSMYLFFYLYLIFITALNFKIRGALYFSIFCALLFTFVLFFETEMSSGSKIFLFLMNNLAFFAVAMLSGSLSLQLELKEKNIVELKNINNLIVDNIKSGLITLGYSLDLVQYNKAAENILGSQIFKNIKNLEFISKIPIYKKDLDKNEVIVKEWSYKPPMSELDAPNRDLEVLISKLSLGSRLRGDLDSKLEEQSGYLLLIQDITERKKIEDRLKNQEKLAAVGQLAAGIAHEIRNPLASMSGSIQLLAKSFESIDDEQKKLISITLKETDRLNNLISEFLEFVRPNLPKDDKVDISKLLKECLEFLQLDKSTMSPPLDLDLKAIGVIKANRDKLKQVFLNMFINAFHAMEKTPSPKLTVKSWNEDEEIVISIRDNGKGMDEGTRKRLFEPFFTTKPRGTGLGLAVAHKILEAHEALIDVNSEINHGTEFKITFGRVR